MRGPYVATAGVLLAGGAARRFGGLPKGLARIHGERIADRVLAALRGAAEKVIVVANDRHSQEWSAERHRDRARRG